MRKGKRRGYVAVFGGIRPYGCNEVSSTSYGAWYYDWYEGLERVRRVIMESFMEQLRKATLRCVTITASNEEVRREHTPY